MCKFTNALSNLTISGKFAVNFELNFSKKCPLFNRIYVYFLGSKRLVNKNFNFHILEDYLMTFFWVKATVCLVKFHQT